MEDYSIVDQSVQNLVIRKSCEKRGFNYMLSATEYGMKNSFHTLNQLMVDLKKNRFDGVAFYSIEQLPNDINFRKKIYKDILKFKKQIFFSHEDILIKNKGDIDFFENLIKIKFLLNFCPKNLK